MAYSKGKIGLFSLALANPQWGKHFPLLGWSQYTLGIYLIHNRLINALEPLSRRYNNSLWELGFPITVFLVSLMIAAVIARIPKMRRFVT